MSNQLALRRNQLPKPKLAAGIIYSGDNGRLICVHCAGMSAKFTGRDLSGHRVTALGQEDADEWMRVMGVPLECESGCTKHPPAAGVTYSESAARAMFGGYVPEPPHIERAVSLDAMEGQ